MPFWAITPDVKSVLTAYNRCAERNALPYAGGVMDQPAELMSDFDVIDQVLSEEKKKRAEDQQAREAIKKPNG